MPLLDHFHPPLFGRRRWESLHAQWATALSNSLNERLPPAYFAETQVTHGTRIEVDVGTFTEDGAPSTADSEHGVTAVQAQVWAPPTPIATMPAVFPDDFEV